MKVNLHLKHRGKDTRCSIAKPRMVAILTVSIVEAEVICGSFTISSLLQGIVHNLLHHSSKSTDLTQGSLHRGILWDRPDEALSNAQVAINNDLHILGHSHRVTKILGSLTEEKQVSRCACGTTHAPASKAWAILISSVQSDDQHGLLSLDHVSANWPLQTSSPKVTESVLFRHVAAQSIAWNGS